EERFLHQVGSINLALQSPVDLQPGQQREIAAVKVEQLSQGCAAAGSGTPQQFLRVWKRIVHARNPLVLRHGTSRLTAAENASAGIARSLYPLVPDCQQVLVHLWQRPSITPIRAAWSLSM